MPITRAQIRFTKIGGRTPLILRFWTDEGIRGPGGFRVPEHFGLVDAPPEPEVKSGRPAIPERPGPGVDLVEERVAPFPRPDLGLGA
ncbi:hypothetical protein [Teichococcus coralli]|uniref:hypothetical protein n=1 Tax=Teichococcus coralli TaxID=2545983 RepID=UPI001928AE6B|nr:hypothetical protein [Pseudoroseomonas coralli]